MVELYETSAAGARLPLEIGTVSVREVQAPLYLLVHSSHHAQAPLSHHAQAPSTTPLWYERETMIWGERVETPLPVLTELASALRLLVAPDCLS